jgi:hypothetical protein
MKYHRRWGVTSLKDATGKVADAAKESLEKAIHLTKDVAEKAVVATKEKIADAVDVTKGVSRQSHGRYQEDSHKSCGYHFESRRSGQRTARKERGVVGFPL